MFWLTFTQLQLIGWLTDWLVADLLTDLLTTLLTNLLTNWLAYCFNYWLADWLTDWLTVWLIDWLTDWQQYSSQIIETKPVFLNFWEILYIHSSHLCSHSNVPLSFPSVEPRVFWSTETTVIPKSTLGKGKITQVFQDQFCDEYCSSLTYRLDWLANVLRFILRKGINLMPLWCESRLLQLLMKMTDFSFQMRFVQQMCQDFNSQDFKLILSTVSVYRLLCNPVIEWTR